MSVIVTSPDGRIFLFTKGADSLLVKKITRNKHMIPSCEQNLLQYAKKGLRTLIILYKELTEVELSEWELIYNIYLNKFRNLQLTKIEIKLLKPLI